MNRAVVLLLCLFGSAGLHAEANQQAASPAARGHEVFEYWCTPCHGDGPGRPGTERLEQRYKGSVPAMLEQRRDLPAQLIRFYVRHGVAVMPRFRKTEISDADLDALCAYLTGPK